MGRYGKFANRMADEAREQWDEFHRYVDDCIAILSKVSGEPKRRPWLVEVIKEIYEEQDGICPLCREPVELGSHHVDHVIPFCWGGGNERKNLQIVHPRCNLEKGKSVEASELIRYLEDRYMNRIA